MCEKVINLKITGNIINTTGQSGIYLSVLCKNASISNNTIVSCEHYGIYADNQWNTDDRSYIFNNTIVNCCSEDVETYSAIYANYANRSVIKGNVIENTSTGVMKYGIKSSSSIVDANNFRNIQICAKPIASVDILRGVNYKDNARLSLNMDNDERGQEILYSWTDISNFKNNGNFPFQIGDYKNITLSNGETLKLVVAGINTYKGCMSGGVQAHVDFISETCLATATTYNSTATNNGGFTSSSLNTYLNSTIYGYLPSELQSVITGKQARWSTVSGTATSTMKIWIPTLAELMGISPNSGNSDYGSGCNMQYPLYKNGFSKILKQVDSNYVNWFTATPDNSTGTSFFAIGSSGMPSSYGATTASMYVPLCFRI